MEGVAILTSLVHYKYVGSTGGGLPHVNTFDEGQPRAARWEREREQERERAEGACLPGLFHLVNTNQLAN